MERRTSTYFCLAVRVVVLNVVLVVVVVKKSLSPTLVMFSQSKSALVFRLTGWVDGVVGVH